MNTINIKPCQYKSNRLPLQATQRDLKAKKKQQQTLKFLLLLQK